MTTLRPCPGTPNCVTSVGVGALPPIPYLPDGRAATEARLVRVLGERARTRIVARTPGYLHAEERSRVFRFVDDVEFAFDDDARVVHFRSASRVGRRDFGVNRRRMVAITAAMTR